MDSVHPGDSHPMTPRPVGRGLDLVIACAVVGLLVVLAIPAQRTVTSETRAAEVRALAASIGGAAAFAHSIWQSQGAPPEIVVKRGRVQLVNGYPTATTVSLLLEESELMAFRPQQGGLQHRSATGGGCAVQYRPSPRRGERPVVSVQTTGC
jgi:hypothetical protein